MIVTGGMAMTCEVGRANCIYRYFVGRVGVATNNFTSVHVEYAGSECDNIIILSYPVCTIVACIT